MTRLVYIYLLNQLHNDFNIIPIQFHSVCIDPPYFVACQSKHLQLYLFLQEIPDPLRNQNENSYDSGIAKDLKKRKYINIE